MLSDSLKVLLASTQSLAIKTQNFHWNIEGSNFPQYHAFLDTLYSDINETIDPVAEYIRILGHYTPGSLTRYTELSIIQDQIKIPRAQLMFAELLHDTEKMGELVVEIFDQATADRQQGIANYMAELQDLYGKKSWFIRSTLKTDRE
jgi:starvation-inducible DNA-binding protein